MHWVHSIESSSSSFDDKYCCYYYYCSSEEEISCSINDLWVIPRKMITTKDYSYSTRVMSKSMTTRMTKMKEKFDEVDWNDLLSLRNRIRMVMKSVEVRNVESIEILNPFHYHNPTFPITTELSHH